LTTDAGVIAPQARLVQALVNQRRVPLAALATCEHAIAPRAQRHPDCPRFQARPGAGPGFAPRRLVACGDHRARDAAAADRHTSAGSAPVTERRGQTSWGHWRRQCPTFLRQPFVAWTAESTRHSFWAPVDDQQHRAQGTTPQAAVRALACQWIRLLLRCGPDRTPSEESVSLHALTSRGSSQLHHLAKGAS
jgi:hypothetical protein